MVHSVGAVVFLRIRLFGKNERRADDNARILLGMNLCMDSGESV